MKTFLDNANRTWTVSITVDSIKRVKGLLGVNLLDAVGGDLLEKLVGDPVLLCDVVFALCKQQAEQLSVSDEDFGRSMAGDAIERATTALLEDLVDFFPGQRRKLLAKALDKLRAMENVAFQAAQKRLDDPSLEAQVLAAVNGSKD
ncbi:MAG TPA: hypothetical protein PKG77_19540 [Phycisphaerae bacterium]|nr:hypothetical protein [Phycisphaerae bacterium]HQL75972.1 hypothetical protein [Phycisphaerae bacterium]